MALQSHFQRRLDNVKVRTKNHHKVVLYPVLNED